MKSLLFFISRTFDSTYLQQLSSASALLVGAAILSLALRTLLIRFNLVKQTDFISNKRTATIDKNHKKKLYLQRILIIVSVLVILLYFAPFIFNGQDTHVKIFDVLDSWLPQAKILAESGKAFSLNPETTLDNVINGLQLSGFNSGYNLFIWLLLIFKPYTAYVLNLLLMAFVGFWGMKLLLSKFIMPLERHNDIVIGVSLCFSLLIFYPPSGISISGIPLLLYCFLNIKHRQEKIWHFMYIVFFPFFSLFHHTGVFILIMLGVIYLVDIYKNRKLNLLYLFALILLLSTYIFTHFHLIYSLLDPNFASFREEIRSSPMPTGECIRLTIQNFIFDRTNSVSGQRLFIMAASGLALVVSLFLGLKKRVNLLILLLIMAWINSVLWGFKYWKGIVFLRDKIPLLNAYNFARFYWLNPVIWSIIFALSLYIVSKTKLGRILVPLFITGQVLFLFLSYNVECRHQLGRENRLHSTLTFKQFFSEDLFQQINEYIRKPKTEYRTVSLGIHPGIAQYNGFYTLDVYTTVYPLAYKHQFKKIIDEELRKSHQVKTVFDSNAKRCYLLASELHGIKEIRGLAFTRGITKEDQHLKIKHLNLNPTALKEMGGEYIFSGVEILNFATNGLSFERIFESDDSPWKIYLYRVI